MAVTVEQNGTEKPAFEWTAKSEEAAVLVAEDRLTDIEISARLQVGRTTLHRWKSEPVFEARVKAHVAVFARRVMQNGIARLDRRVAALQDRWERLQRVIEERGEEMAGAPGGSTGLLVRTVKSIGAFPNAREVEEYAVDAVLLRELREHEKQAAQELGQWTDKQEVVVTEMTDDERATRLAELLQRGRDRRGLPAPHAGGAGGSRPAPGGVAVLH